MFQKSIFWCQNQVDKKYRKIVKKCEIFDFSCIKLVYAILNKNRKNVKIITRSGIGCGL